MNLVMLLCFADRQAAWMFHINTPSEKKLKYTSLSGLKTFKTASFFLIICES